MKQSTKGLLLCPAAAVCLLQATTAIAAQRLNNFVTQLLEVRSPAAGNYASELPADGWLFVRLRGGRPGARLHLKGRDEPLIEFSSGDVPVHEAMVFQEAGEFTLRLSGGPADLLEARKVPEIYYNKHQYDPYVLCEGPFDWEFVKSVILPHVNVIVGMRDEDQSRLAVPWRRGGGRWMVEVLAPGLHAPPPEGDADVEACTRALSTDAGLDLPWMDGFIVDEYYPSARHVFEPTLSALKRIRDDKRFAEKRLDLYVAGGDDEEMNRFMRKAVELGSKLVFEAYNPEQPSESEAAALLQRRLPDRIQAFGKVIDNAPAHMIVCLGMYNSPPESVNCHPQVNYRVFQDMEFHVLANDPAFQGLFGISEYTSGYADRETITWVGQLFRHYCIEGRTDRLSDEPYILDHLHNPDFGEGTSGWTVEAASPDSIEVRDVKDLGSRQARMGCADAGDRCLLMHRKADGPNVVSQTIRNLEPGREYALRLNSTNLIHRPGGYGNPTFDDVETVTIMIDGAERLPAYSHTYTYRSIRTRGLMYFNYHTERFRATAPTAQLRIMDWAGPKERKRNVDRESAFNFVEIQPCLPESRPPAVVRTGLR